LKPPLRLGTVTRLQEALVRFNADLTALGCRWALVGGLAVSVYAEPRPTKDVDVAVAVSGDREAEQVVYELRRLGYRELPEQPILETIDTERLATVRLLVPGNPGEDGSGIIADALFSFSGLEVEMVAAAEVREVLPGFSLPVVRAGHLLALKVQAGRPKDLEDARNLLRVINPSELQLARDALVVMGELRVARGRDLLTELARLHKQA
jgi:hypothetical protein